MTTTTENATTYDTFFQVRRGLIVKLVGLPNDLTIREAERLVRMIRTLAFPEDSLEVCTCKVGAAAPGYSCPACGALIPEREREASERMASMSPREIVAEAFGYMLTGRPPPEDVRTALAAVVPPRVP